jgi:hypothetical protein
VFVHLPTNSIFELNETGAAAWDLLQDGLDPGAVGRRLAEQFSISSESATLEVEALVEDLRTRGLIA